MLPAMQNMAQPFGQKKSPTDHTTGRGNTRQPADGAGGLGGRAGGDCSQLALVYAAVVLATMGVAALIAMVV